MNFKRSNSAFSLRQQFIRSTVKIHHFNFFSIPPKDKISLILEINIISSRTHLRIFHHWTNQPVTNYFSNPLLIQKKRIAPSNSPNSQSNCKSPINTNFQFLISNLVSSFFLAYQNWKKSCANFKWLDNVSTPLVLVLLPRISWPRLG